MTEFAEQFDNPISTYTSDQGVEDGFLVIAAPNGYGTRVLFTRAVFEAVDGADGDGRTYEQKAIPLINDAVMICRGDPKEHLWTKGLEGNVTGREVWVAKNESGGLTLMFPEDY